jgi:hypothetical protein
MDEIPVGTVHANTVASEANQVCVSELSPLNYVDVKIRGVPRTIAALDDGGSEIAVLKSDVLDSCDVDYVSVGSVRLRGIVGSPVEANLIKLQVQLDTDGDYCLSVICAVCRNANEDLILPSSVVEQLFALQHQKMCRDDVECDSVGDYVVSNTVDVDGCQVAASSEAVTDDKVVNDMICVGSKNQTSDSPDVSLSQIIDVESITECENKSTNADVIKLAREQKADPTLKSCFLLLKHAKGGYLVKNDLLYRVEPIFGQITELLVVPMERRRSVLHLAHDLSHQAMR